MRKLQTKLTIFLKFSLVNFIGLTDKNTGEGLLTGAWLNQ